MHVLIRADGGPEIGFGHLMRTSVLSNELHLRGHKVTYLTETPTHVNKVCGDYARVIKIPDNNDNLNYLIDTIQLHDANVVILDCFEADIRYQQEVRGHTTTLAHFQHYNQHKIACDILINGSIYATEMDLDWIGSEPSWCQGLDYILLRKSFQKLAKKSSDWRPKPQQALITMGGSDVNNTTPMVMRHVDIFEPDFKTIVVVGPGFQNQEKIKKTASQLSAPFNIIVDPPNLPELMFESDFAISATGTTIYELVATQTPVIGVAESDNQQLLAETLANRELGITLKQLCWEDAIATVTNNKKLRRSLFEKYNSLIDGNGHKRIVDVIEQKTINKCKSN